MWAIDILKANAIVDMKAQQLQRIIDTERPHCLSIFLPTHPKGQEKENRQDALVLKNQLKDLIEDLKSQGLTQSQATDFVDPIYDKLRDPLFWRYQKVGLAIFSTADSIEYYTLPFPVPSQVHVGSRFYVIPLIPFFHLSESRYRVLALDGSDIKVFEGDKYHMKELDLSGFLPHRREEVVGYDYTEKHRTLRSIKSHGNSGVSHGQRDGRTEKKEENLKYFKAINDAFVSYFKKDTEIPLVVASTDHSFALYKSVNTYPNLQPKNYTGHPSYPLKIDELIALLGANAVATKNERLSTYMQLAGTGRTSDNPKEIVAAASQGRIDTLFITEMPLSEYDVDVAIENTRSGKSAGLSPSDINLSVLNTYSKQGKVYLTDPAKATEITSPVFALMRY